MKYVFATDYDGTLYQYNESGLGISKKTLDAIKEFRKRGNLFGVVTGRSYKWAYPIFKQQNLFEFDYILSDNGAQCVDKDGNFIFSNKIKAYKGFAKDYVTTVLGFGDGIEEAGICFEKDRFNFEISKPDGDEYYDRYSLLDEPLLCECDEFVMVNAVCKDDETASGLKEVLTEKFGEYICPAQNGRCLDITAIGVNKASGIKQYAEKMGVDENNIYSAGDNYNDIVMVKAFHGCAVKNAVQDLKDAAEFIVDDVGDIVNMIFTKE